MASMKLGKRNQAKSPKKAKRKPYTMKAILQEIREAILDDVDVNSVMTAMRGPDDGNFDMKMATTCLLRYRALGGDAYGAVFSQDNGRLLKVRTKAKTDPRYCHFLNHVRCAFTVLGLKFYEDNGVITPLTK